MNAPAPKKKLPTWAILLLVLGGFALLGAAALAALGLYIYSKKDDLLKEGKEAFARADKYAKGHTQEQCVDEAFREFAKCPSFKCEVNNGLFTTRCMKRATPSPRYCENVPKQTDFVKLTTWSIAECTRRGYMQDQACSRLLQQVSAGCHPDARHGTTADD